MNVRVTVVERATPGTDGRGVDLGLAVDDRCVWVAEGIPTGEGATFGDWKWYRDQRSLLEQVARALNRLDGEGIPENAVVVPVGYVEALMTLAAGCPVHPAYRARRKPGRDCPTCRTMWAARQRLACLAGSVPDSARRSYSVSTGFR